MSLTKMLPAGSSGGTYVPDLSGAATEPQPANRSSPAMVPVIAWRIVPLFKIHLRNLVGAGRSLILL